MSSKTNSKEAAAAGGPSPVVHDEAWLDSSWRSRLRRRLIAWYQQNARDLPWRRRPDPYRVWVSEIMCQQTQIATVLPYFDRFLAAFPSVVELAEADERELMRHWEGLGYYRRARSMHAAAKQIVQRHQGVFPESYDEVIALPGIGRYTAGAILSISRDQRLPVLEGNTQRVFSRWIAMAEPPGQTSANRLLWRVAETMLPRKQPGTFNQAAMELGSLVCVPRRPQCDRCPVRRFCAAHRDGVAEQIPGKGASVEYEDRTEFALVVGDRQQGYLMRPLPDGGRWAGLWDFPRPTAQTPGSAGEAADWLSGEIGQRVQSGARLKTIRHAVTKYRIVLHVHQAEPAAADLGELPAPWRLVSDREIAELPLSTTGRKIAELLRGLRQPHLPLTSSGSW